MITLQIKNRYTHKVIFEYTCNDNTMKQTVEEAIRQKISLGGADLSEAQLIKACLIESKLIGTDLTRANLDSAYLIAANLTNVILYDTNLNNAKF